MTVAVMVISLVNVPVNDCESVSLTVLDSVGMMEAVGDCMTVTDTVPLVSDAVIVSEPVPVKRSVEVGSVVADSDASSVKEGELVHVGVAEDEAVEVGVGTSDLVLDCVCERLRLAVSSSVAEGLLDRDMEGRSVPDLDSVGLFVPDRSAESLGLALTVSVSLSDHSRVWDIVTVSSTVLERVSISVLVWESQFVSECVSVRIIVAVGVTAPVAVSMRVRVCDRRRDRLAVRVSRLVLES